MSGSFTDAAGPTIDADMAATAAGVAAAMVRVGDRMAESGMFIAEHGAGVNAGHTPVGDVPPSLAGA